MKRTSAQLTDDLPQPAPLIGRDEMNLAEFPIALLADRAPKGQKTLYFEDLHGRLTVTSSDAYGLPTAADTDVIVALIYLTKIRNGFTDVKVNFSRYELIKLLNWRDEGDSYKRLDQSFNRWGGVWLVYDKCWWNNRLKCYTDAKMHIIDSVEILDSDARRKSHRSGQVGLPFSYFTWNRTFIESCQADNLRQLDLDTYFSLKSAVSKRLYRFLGKRFYTRRDYEFDLNEIAFDRVGLSRNYGDAGKIKEKLQPAIDELEAIGFLKPLRPESRYKRIDRGEWLIRLSRGSSAVAIAAQEATGSPVDSEPSPLVKELAKRGVTRSTAEELVKQHPAEIIEVKLEVLDWLIEKQDKRAAQSPAGYLVTSIQKDYATPKGFLSKAERQRREEARRAADLKAAENHRSKREAERQQAEERKAVNAAIEALSPDERADLVAELLDQADLDTRKNYESSAMLPFRETLTLIMLRDHFTAKRNASKVLAEA